MPEKVIAYCGLDCAACPAFHGAERLSVADREAVARKWTTEFNSPFTANDIDCVGCSVTQGAHVAYCAMCKIRACAQGRALSNCAACPEFACDQLEGFLTNVPQARETLVALRRG